MAGGYSSYLSLMTFSPRLPASQSDLSCLQLHQNWHVFQKKKKNSFGFSMTSFNKKLFIWTIANTI